MYLHGVFTIVDVEILDAMHNEIDRLTSNNQVGKETIYPPPPRGRRAHPNVGA